MANGRAARGAGRREPGSTPPRFEEVPLVHAGEARPYLLKRPTRRPDSPALVVQLHGRGIDPATFDRWTGFSDLADEQGFVLALPRAIGGIWSDGRFIAPPRAGSSALDDPDDVGYLLAMIDDIAARLPIDASRVYVVGMSNGATMAGRLACERPERFAAIAQVAGTAGTAVAARGRPATPLAVLQIHGTADRFAPYAGGRARGPLVRLLLRGRAGPSVGVEDWARLWIEVNGASDVPAVETLPPDTTVRRWSGPSPASDVVFYRVVGAGHTWPGAREWIAPIFGRTSPTFDATRAIWDFLRVHARPA